MHNHINLDKQTDWNVLNQTCAMLHRKYGNQIACNYCPLVKLNLETINPLNCKVKERTKFLIENKIPIKKKDLEAFQYWIKTGTTTI